MTEKEADKLDVKITNADITLKHGEINEKISQDILKIVQCTRN